MNTGARIMNDDELAAELRAGAQRAKATRAAAPTATPTRTGFHPARAAKTGISEGVRQAKADDSPASVKECWWLVVFTVIGMQLISLAVWGGSVTAQPHWYAFMHVGSMIYAVILLVHAYKRRNHQS